MREVLQHLEGVGVYIYQIVIPEPRCSLFRRANITMLARLFESPSFGLQFILSIHNENLNVTMLQFYIHRD
jgi:hypothetical protein